MSNEDSKRLVRIETRLTNLGRHFGFDLTRKPPPNEPDQPVYIDGGHVYATPTTTIGEIMVAVLRYQHWRLDDREVPIIVGGREVAIIDPHETAEKLRQNNGENHSEKQAQQAGASEY